MHTAATYHPAYRKLPYGFPRRTMGTRNNPVPQPQRAPTHPAIQTRACLVPTLPRGNAYNGDIPPSLPKAPVWIPTEDHGNQKQPRATASTRAHAPVNTNASFPRSRVGMHITATYRPAYRKLPYGFPRRTMGTRNNPVPHAHTPGNTNPELASFPRSGVGMHTTATYRPTNR